jgi:hypothetical protein
MLHGVLLCNAHKLCQRKNGDKEDSEKLITNNYFSDFNAGYAGTNHRSFIVALKPLIIELCVSYEKEN